jgi:CRP-like cAMP-binding protein
MQELKKVLEGHVFFRDMENRYLQTLSAGACQVHFERGEELFREGDEANYFYLLLSGKVALFLPSYHTVPLEILTLGEGEILGWSWLFSPYRWKLTAIAQEVTRAISLDGKFVREKCEEEHDLGYELMKRFAHVIDSRLEALSLHLVEVT